MSYEDLSQDQINDLYSQHEIECHVLEGRYFTGKKWKDSFAQARVIELRTQMRHLVHEYGASSLPFN